MPSQRHLITSSIKCSSSANTNKVTEVAVVALAVFFGPVSTFMSCGVYTVFSYVVCRLRLRVNKRCVCAPNRPNILICVLSRLVIRTGQLHRREPRMPSLRRRPLSEPSSAGKHLGLRPGRPNRHLTLSGTPVTTVDSLSCSQVSRCKIGLIQIQKTCI